MSTPSDEIPLRTCPHCGVESRTRFERCPNCGKSLFDEPPRFSRTTKLVAGIAIGVLVLAVGAVLVSTLAGGERDKDKRNAAEQSQLVARERARLIREQSPRRGRPPATVAKPPASATDAEKIAARVALLRAMEDDITRDARGRMRAGELRGPIRYTKCGSLGPTATVRDEERDPSRSTGRYDCVAVIRDVVDNGKLVGRYGHSFVGTVDFERWRYVWCRNNPAPSERGKALVFVRLPRVCLGAEGAPTVGTGYVAPDK